MEDIALQYQQIINFHFAVGIAAAVAGLTVGVLIMFRNNRARFAAGGEKALNATGATLINRAIPVLLAAVPLIASVETMHVRLDALKAENPSLARCITLARDVNDKKPGAWEQYTASSPDQCPLALVRG